MMNIVIGGLQVRKINKVSNKVNYDGKRKRNSKGYTG